jgi:hypothetical protein
VATPLERTMLADCARSDVDGATRSGYFNFKERTIMNFQRRILVAIISGFAMLLSVIGVSAQATKEKTAASTPVVVQVEGIEARAGTPVIAGQGDNTFVFVRSEMSFDEKIVKGAPYSAQSVSESVQTLADGNRIVRRDSSAIYRDSEGRTRREQTLGSLGAYAVSGDAPQMTFINDPVAGVNYILDSKNHTAQKMDLKVKTIAARNKVIAESKFKTEINKSSESEPGAVVVEVNTGGPGEMGMAHSMKKSTLNSKDVKKESLGKQTIEGVEAEGARTTVTIAAGEIGNDAPINIVSETWYSPDLQTVVMSKHSDPRTGELTYRLTNINRSEPAHSLFEVPSDYTVKDSMHEFNYKIESRQPAKEKQDQ